MIQLLIFFSSRRILMPFLVALLTSLTTSTITSSSSIEKTLVDVAADEVTAFTLTSNAIGQDMILPDIYTCKASIDNPNDDFEAKVCYVMFFISLVLVFTRTRAYIVSFTTQALAKTGVFCTRTRIEITINSSINSSLHLHHMSFTHTE